MASLHGEYDSLRGMSCDGAQIYSFVVQSQLTTLDARHVEEVFHETHHLADLSFNQ
jgi:hypothetical protein